MKIGISILLITHARGRDRLMRYRAKQQYGEVATEMALNVLAYNMKRVMMIVGVCGLLEVMRA